MADTTENPTELIYLSYWLVAYSISTGTPIRLPIDSIDSKFVNTIALSTDCYSVNRNSIDNVGTRTSNTRTMS